VSKFVILPCLDSEQMAASRRRELDLSKYAAASLGRSALEAIRKGFYVTGAGQEVSWRDAVEAARAAKRSIDPDALLPRNEQIANPETKVQVTNETTLGASLRLVGRGLRPLALNFANGIHPGGGFLGGARAQEEVLCRSSALYETLVDDPMYKEHRKRPQPDSTDWAIYSPDIPVFRADDGTAVQNFWLFERHYVCCPLCPRHWPTAIRRSFEETNSPRARHRTVLRIQHVGAGRMGLWRLP
jgi:uncharacterized protein (TIGR02452 family)